MSYIVEDKHKSNTVRVKTTGTGKARKLGFTVVLGKATQAELKKLAEMKHPLVQEKGK